MCLAQSPLPVEEGWKDGGGHPDPLPTSSSAYQCAIMGSANVVSADGEKLCVAKLEVNGNGATLCSKLTSLKNR